MKGIIPITSVVLIVLGMVASLGVGYLGYTYAQNNLTLGAGLNTFQGGTGSTSPSGILYGDETIRLKTTTIGSGLSFSGGTLSATGDGSDSVSTSSSETSGRVPFWTSTSATPALLSGGSASFTWDDTLSRLTVSGLVSTNSTSTNATTTNLFVLGDVEYDTGAHAPPEFIYDSGLQTMETTLVADGSSWVVNTYNAAQTTYSGLSFNDTGEWAADASSGLYQFFGADSYGVLSMTGINTSDKTFTFPNTSGTVCLTTTCFAVSAYDAWTHPAAGQSATTSTLILTTGGLVVNAASSTFAGNILITGNATATNATTTSFFSTFLTATTGIFTNLFIGVDTIAEYIADTVGAMVTGNTETDITVTYDDADNTLDFVVDTLPNLTGVLDYDSGGTGTTTAPVGEVLYGGATAYQSVATGTISAGTGISLSATAYALLNALAISINQAANLTWTGIHDFTGGEVRLPTDEVTNAEGEVTTDTTSGQVRIFATTQDVYQGERVPVFGYATSTTWTGTTTLLLAPAAFAQTWETLRCETDAGFIGVSVYDAGGNRMNYSEASTTIGSNTLDTNNTFTLGESRRVDFGTTTTSVAKKISCSVLYDITAD